VSSTATKRLMPKVPKTLLNVNTDASSNGTASLDQGKLEIKRVGSSHCFSVPGIENVNVSSN
jgi:hypothetical protein